MQVREARALAARWVADHAAEVPGFAGALLGGSTAWLPDGADLPATSDVDVMVVTGDPATPPNRSKRRYGGALLEVTVLPLTQLRSPEQVLASYHLAGLLHAGVVLADPTGRLAELRAATARDFAKRVWVRRRCRDAEQRILDGLGGLDPSAPLPAQVLTWVFPTGVTTHVLLTAGLRNPTVRLRYLAVRTLLGDYGRLAFQEELLALLGCAQLPRERVGQHLAAMTAAFDTATLALSNRQVVAEGAGNGAANVWRVVPGRAPAVFASGLTAVVDVAFGPDGSLYGSEFVPDWTSASPSGAVVRIRPNGRRTVLGQGSLFFPGGVAVGRHGQVYVANWSILPATGNPEAPPGARGQVVRLRG